MVSGSKNASNAMELSWNTLDLERFSDLRKDSSPIFHLCQLVDVLLPCMFIEEYAGQVVVVFVQEDPGISVNDLMFDFLEDFTL